MPLWLIIYYCVCFATAKHCPLCCSVLLCHATMFTCLHLLVLRNVMPHDILARMINNSHEQITADFIRDNASCVACSRFFCMQSLVLSDAQHPPSTSSPDADHSRYIRRVSRAITFVSLPFHSAAISCFIADGSRRRRGSNPL